MIMPSLREEFTAIRPESKKARVIISIYQFNELFS